MQIDKVYYTASTDKERERKGERRKKGDTVIEKARKEKLTTPTTALQDGAIITTFDVTFSRLAGSSTDTHLLRSPLPSSGRVRIPPTMLKIIPPNA